MVDRLPTVGTLPTFDRLPGLDTLPRVDQLPTVQPLVDPISNFRPFSRSLGQADNTLIFDYDSTEEVNSFADVLYRYVGRIGKDLSEGNVVGAIGTYLFDTDYYRDLYDLGKGIIDPALQGKWDVTGLNLLNNAMETLDILANPVKGAFLDSQGFLNGLKEGSIGRVNYDLNSGSLIKDIGFEIAVDPLNWITLGGKAALTGSVKAGAEVLTETVEGLSKRNARRIARNVIQSARSADDIAEGLTATLAKRRLLSELPEEALGRLATLATDDLNMTLIKSVGAMIRGAEVLDSAMINSALLFTPKAFKALGDPVYKYINSRVMNIKRKYTGPGGSFTSFNYVNALPELQQRLDTLKALDDSDLPREILASVGHRTILDDTANIRAIITNYRGDIPKLREGLEAFAREAGTNWDDYKGIVENLTLGTDLRGTPDILLELVTDIDNILKFEPAELTRINIDYRDFNVDFQDLLSLGGDPKQFLADLNTDTNVIRFADDIIAIYNKYDTLKEFTKDYIGDIRNMVDDAIEKGTSPQLIGLDIIEALQRAQDAIRFGIEDYKVAVEDVEPIFDEALSKYFASTDKQLEKLNQLGVTQVKDMSKNLDIKNWSVLSDTDVEWEYTIHDFVSTLEQISKVSSTEMYGPLREMITSEIDAITAKLHSIISGNATELDHSVLAEELQLLAQNLNYVLKPLEAQVAARERVTQFTLDFISELNEVIDFIDEITINRMPEDLVDVGTDTVLYNFKVSQQRSNIDLYTADGLEDLMFDMEYMTERGALFNSLLQSNRLTPEAKQLYADSMLKISGMAKAKQLYSQVLHNTKLTQEAKVSFIDTLNKFSRRQMNYDLYLNEEFFMNNLIDTTDVNLRSTYTELQYNLESFIARDPEGFNNYMKANYPQYADQQALHDAGFDVALTRYVAETNGIDLSDTITFDLETTGLTNSDGDQIIQIAFTEPDGSITTLVASPPEGIYPPESVMRQQLGGSDTPTELLYKEWDGKFRGPDALTEEQLLREFNNRIDKARTLKSNPVLSGHNIDTFDMPMMRRRMFVNKIPVPRRVTHIDTYQEVLAKDNVKTLTQVEREEMRKMLRKYFTSREGEIGYQMYLESAFKQQIEPTGIREFIESPDDTFATNLRQLGGTLVDSAGADSYDNLIRDLGSRLNQTSASVFSKLRDLKAFNRNYANIFLDANDLPKAFSGIDPAYYQTHITKVLQDGSGLLQSIAPKKLVDTELVRNIYYGIEGTYNKNILHSMTTTATQIDKIRNQIKNIAPLIEETDINELREVFNFAKTQLEFRLGGALPAHIKYLQFHEADLRTGFAQIKYLMAKITRDIKNEDVIAQMYDSLGFDLSTYLRDFNQLRKPIGDIESNEKFFIPDHGTDDIANIYDYNVSNRRPYSDIQEAELRKAEYNITNSRMLRSVESFREIATLLDDTATSAQRVKKNIPQHIDELKRWNNEASRQQLARAVNMNPEELQSYLYHHAMGILTFRGDDLSIEGLDLMNNREAYEMLGIRYHFEGDRVYIYLDKSLDYDPKYTLATADVDLPETSYDTFEDVNLDVRANNIRRKIIQQEPRAMATNMELFSENHFIRLWESMPKVVQDNMFDIDMLRGRHIFSQTNFNNSVLGTISSRRELLPHIYNNPLKSMYQTMQRIDQVATTQVKYTNAMFSEQFKLSGEWFSEFSNEDLLQSIRNSDGMVVGFLEEHKKLGYKLRQIKPRSVKDIARLKELDAVIMPIDFMNAAEDIINSNKITPTIFRVFDKYFVGTTKLGQLSSPGFLFRNIFDSTQKNIISLGTFDAVPHLFDTAKLYDKYHRVMQDLIKEHGHITSEGIEQYFKGSPLLDKDTFDIIHEFINDGASAGLTQVVEESFSNTFKLLQRRTKYPAELDWEVIRDFIEKPQYRNPDMYRPDLYSELVRLRSEFDFYHKAAAMAERTRLKNMTVDDIVRYMKFPQQIPPELVKEFDKLSKVKPVGEMRKAFDRRVFENPYSRFIMSANTYVEQIERLSNYLYSVRIQGLSKADASARVIATHFDNAHKNTVQKYLEMMLPFITFSYRNFMFWADVIDDAPTAFRHMRDVMSPVANLDEYSQWDLENRRSLQYQILNGAVILDRDTGFNIKLSPSVMDAYSLFYKPWEVATGRLVPAVRTPLEMITVEKEDWMDEEWFRQNRINQWLGAIPGIGPTITRLKSGARYYEETGNILNRAVPSIFGRTNLPKQITYPARKFDYSSQGYYSTTTYKGYNNTRPTPLPYAFYAVQSARYKDLPGLPSTYRKVNRHDKNDLFTAKGKSKLALAMLPQRPGDAKFALNYIWSRWLR